MSGGILVGLGAVIAGGVAAVAPWASQIEGQFIVDGMDSNGEAVLVGTAVATVSLFFLATRPGRAAITGLIIAAAITAIASIDSAIALDDSSSSGFQDALGNPLERSSLEWGIYLALAVPVLLLIASAVVYLERSTATRPAGEA